MSWEVQYHLELQLLDSKTSKEKIHQWENWYGYHPHWDISPAEKHKKLIFGKLWPSAHTSSHVDWLCLATVQSEQIYLWNYE